jgi:hypothetical protein
MALMIAAAPFPSCTSAAQSKSPAGRSPRLLAAKSSGADSDPHARALVLVLPPGLEGNSSDAECRERIGDRICHCGETRYDDASAPPHTQSRRIQQ